jgi:hypothetical protein
MKRFLQSVCAASLLFVSSAVMAAGQVYYLKYEDNGAGSRRLIEEKSVTATEAPVFEGNRHELSYPQFIAEHQPVGAQRIVEVWSRTRDGATRIITERALTRPGAAEVEAAEDAADELFTIVESGSPENRIDLVFMGDGYTQAERQKFIDDIQRMVNDMFVGHTFASYLPLFNVYAVFRASVESGIGKNDRPKNTAYQLYREGNTLRAIYPGNTSALRASCRVAPGCDYPVVIANDPYYGGLGGEFAVSTSSHTSGTVVLRHELGHNFGRVGEEYDGGGYFGANNSSSVSGLKWKQWATESSVRAEPSKARFLDWPWHNLSQGPYTASFSCNEDYPHAAVRFSASGFAASDSLKIELDGKQLEWTTSGTDDRSFYNYEMAGFGRGSHALKFTQMENDGNNWVSSLTVHEYAADYNFDPEFVGAYPVFNKSGTVAGYRPTHETCLMREMQSVQFCSVCQENNWIEFFQRVKMIDSLDVERTAAGVNVRLETLQLGQYRAGGIDAGTVEIRWKRNGQAMDAFNDMAAWSLPARDAEGTWAAEVVYKTPEIRKQTIRDQKSVTIN